MVNVQHKVHIQKIKTRELGSRFGRLDLVDCKNMLLEGRGEKREGRKEGRKKMNIKYALFKGLQ